MTAPAAVSPVVRSLAAGPDRVAYRAPRPPVAFQGAGRATPAARLDTLTEHPLPPARCKLGLEVAAALRREPVREEVPA